MPLDEARQRLGPDVAVQGNLDPRCAWPRGPRWPRPPPTCSPATAGGPGHIFNLGHGVLPETDPDTLARLVELVHAWEAPA